MTALFLKPNSSAQDIVVLDGKEKQQSRVIQYVLYGEGETTSTRRLDPPFSTKLNFTNFFPLNMCILDSPDDTYLR